MSPFKYVGVLGHPKRPATEPIARTIARSLEQRGIATWHQETWQEGQIASQLEHSDLVVAIGGDGAMLRTARVCAPFGVPVLGVNMGRLGFLTEIASPEEWENALVRILAGHGWQERRMMIRARVWRDGELVTSGDALNEVVISATSAGSMIQLDTYIDAHWASTYSSDALIISTPTGSTAYALAAGGPILPPDLRNILIIPTAPHLSMDRPIILSQGAKVAVRLNVENRYEVQTMMDGMHLAPLESGDILQIETSPHDSIFLRLREQTYFYRSLLDRLEPRVKRTLPEPILPFKG